MISTLLEKIKTTKIQLISMLVVAIYSTILFTIQHQRTIFPEPLPQFLHIDKKTQSLATPITVGIHINSFQDFSFTKNNFSIDAIIWFKFAKSTESLYSLDKFTIFHSKLLGNGSLIYKLPPIIKLLDKDVLVCYNIQANFMAPLDFKKFPFENHRLTIILQNKTVNIREVNFITDNKYISMSDNIFVEDWMPTKFTATSGYFKTIINTHDQDMNITHPCVAFSIDFESIGARLPISLYFPLFILFFIMLISLTLSFSDSNRLTIASAAIPALVLFRLVIDTVSPIVGYSTHIDKVYYLIVFLSLIILFFQTYVALVIKKDINISNELKQIENKRLETANAIIIMTILILLIVFLTFSFI